MRKGKGGGAPMGNQNAAKNKNGAKLGALSSFALGPAGAIATGTYVGATKSPNAIKRHNTAATTVGVLGGVAMSTLKGGVVAPIVLGAATGNPALIGIGAAKGIVGGALLGGLSYGGAKLGQYAGKRIKSKV